MLDEAMEFSGTGGGGRPSVQRRNETSRSVAVWDGPPPEPQRGLGSRSRVGGVPGDLEREAVSRRVQPGGVFCPSARDSAAGCGRAFRKTRQRRADVILKGKGVREREIKTCA